MNAIVESKSPVRLVEDHGRMAVADVVQQAIVIKEVMVAVMKEGVHYGVIPGTDKPTLFKAGAEKLCMTFRIADEYRIEDLSAGTDVIRYRVTCLGFHQQTRIELGQGLGEASTGEEKYKWRKAVCKEEFDATPVNMRRVKYGKKSGGFYTVDQIRCEPADLANTVLKMAVKRAKMAMVLNVLAASDAFTSDLDDLTDELREHLTESERDAAYAPLRSEWARKVEEAPSVEILEALRKPATAAFQKAKDSEGYALFMVAAKARAASLRTPPPTTTSAAPATDVDPFVATLEAAEKASKEGQP